MKLHRFSTVVVCAASLCVAASAQERPDVIARVSGNQPFHAGIAGTCTNKDDFSFTGTAAGLAPGLALRIHCVVAGKSTHGQYTAQILAEEQVTPNPCMTAAGAGGLEAAVKGFIVVLSFAATEDQLFLRLGGGGTQCLTAPGTVAPGQATLSVLGGTGRYQGATGSVVSLINPIALAFSALGGDGFLSAFSGTLDGFISLK